MAPANRRADLARRSLVGCLVCGCLLLLSACQQQQSASSSRAATRVRLTEEEEIRFANLFADQAVAEAPRNLPRAREIWQRAKQEYRAALEKSPDNARALFSYAATLSDEAEVLAATDFAAARELWDEAKRHYDRALKVNPREDRAANSWGLALAAEAKIIAASDLPLARQLWREAGEKYALALQILPTKHGAANNWGNALADEAVALAETDLKEARVRWENARDKYRWALRIKPDKFNAMSNWGRASANEAEALAKAGQWPEAERLWVESVERFEACLALNGRFQDALYNLGTSLHERAELLAPIDPPRARELWGRARAFLERTLAVNPTHLFAAQNLAASFEAELRALGPAPTPSGFAQWDQVIFAHQRVLKISPNLDEALTGLAKGLDGKARLLAKHGDLSQARSVWREAKAAYARSMQAKPNASVAGNWGLALMEEADWLRHLEPLVAHDLSVDAIHKLSEAIRLDPTRYPATFNLAAAYQQMANAYFWQDRNTALEYYRRVEEQVIRARVLAPEAVEPPLLLADALCAQALILARKEPSTALELCRRADEQFARLAGRDGVTGPQTWSWARALAKEAEALSLLDRPRALRAFDATAAKFVEASEEFATEPRFFVTWGQALQAKAQALAIRDLATARQNWAEARDKFAKKLRLDPDSVDAPLEIGLTFLREYAALPSVTRATNGMLLDEAEKSLLAAEALAPGMGAYNLACVSAWRNQPKECVAWLERSRKFGRLPNRQIVLGDSYLRLVAKSDEFRQWLTTVYPTP